jgi:CO/xanthine dehydrogenase Mo-binding subunit
MRRSARIMAIITLFAGSRAAPSAAKPRLKGLAPTSGLAFSSRTLVEAYRRGTEQFGWERRNPVPRSQREGDWLIGYGVATATYPYYRMPGGSARIHLSADGRAVVQMASHEMGMGTATAQAQHAAERLGLPVSLVTFEYGDTALPSGDRWRFVPDRVWHTNAGEADKKKGSRRVHMSSLSPARRNFENNMAKLGVYSVAAGRTSLAYRRLSPPNRGG